MGSGGLTAREGARGGSGGAAKGCAALHSGESDSFVIQKGTPVHARRRQHPLVARRRVGGRRSSSVPVLSLDISSSRSLSLVDTHPVDVYIFAARARTQSALGRGRRAAVFFLAQWGRDEATSGSVRSSRRTMTFDRNFVVSRIAPRGSPAHGGAGAR